MGEYKANQIGKTNIFVCMYVYVYELLHICTHTYGHIYKLWIEQKLNFYYTKNSNKKRSIF